MSRTKREPRQEVKAFSEASKGRTVTHRNSFRDIKRVYLELTAPEREDKTRRQTAKEIAEQKANAKMERQKAEIAQKRAENGQNLLKLVLENSVLKLSKPGLIDLAMLKMGKTIGGADQQKVADGQRRWAMDCNDVIFAAKNSGTHFTWNKDWYETGELLIFVTNKIKRMPLPRK